MIFDRNVAFVDTKAMFAFRDRLSPRARYRLGFWMCPLLTWLFEAVHIAVVINTNPTLSRVLGRPTVWILLGAGLAFWIALTLFSGFMTAFFWVDLRNDEKAEKKWAFCSVAVACLGHLVWCGGLPILLYFGFLFLFRRGLAVGHTFWESNRPRQFFGDFSDMGDDSS